MSDVITAKGLTMQFPGCEVLRGIDLRVAPGTVFALLGENGAGKTTLIRILTGFLRPSSGSCQVLGLDPTQDDLEIRRRIGYVSDAPALYDWMRVDEIGWFASSFYPEGYIQRYREAVDKFDLPLTRKIKHLSKGQRAKVALALALAHDPELLILDEPTSGLDPLVRREFLESMIERAATGRTVFLSSHQIAEVERVADEIAILNDGCFQVVESMCDLRDRIHEVTVSLSDPLIELPHAEETASVLSDETQGRQRRFILRGECEPTVDTWRAASGVISVQSRPATLDELFVAAVSKRGPGVSKQDTSYYPVNSR